MRQRQPSRMSKVEAAEMVARRVLAVAKAESLAQGEPAPVDRGDIRESGAALGLTPGRDYVVDDVIRHLRQIVSQSTADLIRSLK